jgi:tetratricopeptide (TPR) repeat protein
MDDRELSSAEYEEERKSFLSQIEAYLDRNELQTVLTLAQARLKRIPGDLDARIGICRVWIQQGRIDESRAMIAEMEESLASFSRIYVCMGDICMKKGMKDSAEAFYRKFTALNPEATRVQDILETCNGIEEHQGTNTERETEGDAAVPSDFQTVTLAELYIRQGHLRQAEKVLERIVGQEPQQEKAAELLREVRDRILGEASVQRNAGIVTELSRWLVNIDRLRGHAA